MTKAAPPASGTKTGMIPAVFQEAEFQEAEGP
jgi:hypothetical protein